MPRRNRGAQPNYSMATPPEQFRSWNEYISFCDRTVQIRIICPEASSATRPADNNIKQSESRISEKLYCDFSHYFQSCLYGPYLVPQFEGIALQDVSINDMRFLNSFLRGQDFRKSAFDSNAAAIPVFNAFDKWIFNQCFYSSVELIRAWKLADRFVMPRITRWIEGTLNNFLAGIYWPLTPVNGVFDVEYGVTGNTHDIDVDFLIDFVNAYMNIRNMREGRRPVDVEHILKWFLDICPSKSLLEVLRYAHPEFVRDIFAFSLRRVQDHV